MRDYCLSYACHPEKRAWAMTAWACVCFGDSAIAAVDRKMPSDLRRCNCIGTRILTILHCRQTVSLSGTSPSFSPARMTILLLH